jgi:hypothetical protein
MTLLLTNLVIVAPGAANAGGAGNGAVQNGQAIGTGTGIANAGPGMIHTYMMKRHGIPVSLIQTSNYIIPGGFGIGLGIGLAVATPLGNLALGEGNSVSVGKK